MSTIQPPPGAGPWRLLILDTSDPADPRWLICSVTLPDDVRPAVMQSGGKRYTDWPDVTEWVRARVGERAALVPIAAIAWRVDENGRPRD